MLKQSKKENIGFDIPVKYIIGFGLVVSILVIGILSGKALGSSSFMF